MPWTQRYDPFGSWPLSTLVSALPVLTLFFVLIVLRRRVWVAALTGMLMAVALAAAVFGMPPSMIASACLDGFVFGFLRIAWIIIASIFLYNVAVETGQFQVMKESIAALSSDQRLQAVLIAFCFGAFLEGTGGGGAPVAIAGSFLIGLGFPPFQAATSATCKPMLSMKPCCTPIVTSGARLSRWAALPPPLPPTWSRYFSSSESLRASRSRLFRLQPPPQHLQAAGPRQPGPVLPSRSSRATPKSSAARACWSSLV